MSDIFVSHQRDKLINAVLFFTTFTQHCHKLKLFKLLSFLDFEHYRQTGYPSIGLEYEAWPMGPVPVALESELDAPHPDLSAAVKITRRKDRNSGKLVRLDLSPKRQFDQRYFSKRELGIMRQLMLFWNDARGEDMSEFSHLRGLPWAMVYRDGLGRGQRIPYKLSIRSQPVTDGETIDTEELEYRHDALDEVVGKVV
jgi:hypothetical protein